MTPGLMKSARIRDSLHKKGFKNNQIGTHLLNMEISLIESSE